MKMPDHALGLLLAYHHWRRAVHAARFEASRAAISVLVMLPHSLRVGLLLGRLEYRKEHSRWMCKHHDGRTYDIRQHALEQIIAGEEAKAARAAREDREIRDARWRSMVGPQEP